MIAESSRSFIFLRARKEGTQIPLEFTNNFRSPGAQNIFQILEQPNQLAIALGHENHDMPTSGSALLAPDAPGPRRIRV
jgi:hypothetical protein